MAMFYNPVTKRAERINDGYDNQDFVDTNSISKKTTFNDLPRVSQLTQNNWNFSPYTRENVSNDTTQIPRIKTKQQLVRSNIRVSRINESRPRRVR